MTMPVPQTLMPHDSLTAARLNGAVLKQPLTAQFRRPRARLIRTGAGSTVSSVQPAAVGFGAGLGSSQYDDVWDGTTFADQTTRRGFLIPGDGRYRLRARWSWQDSASATAGLRYLGLYQGFGSFVSDGGSIGNTLAGINNDGTAIAWAIGRRQASTVCQANIDVTVSLMKGMSIQLGVCQNSGITLGFFTGAAFCWFSCHYKGAS